MKKILTGLSLVLGTLSLIGCGDGTDYASTCENGGAYKEHDYKIVNILDDEDGWFKYKCQNCGLEFKTNLEYESDIHYGAIEIYKNPSTGQFDDYRINYLDEDNVHHLIKITPNDIHK